MQKYDLQNRVTEFSKDVLDLCRKLPQDAVSRPLISQLVRSATSVGANYMEANGAQSDKDFSYKLFLCKKEAQEAEYWIDLLISQFAIPQEELLRLRVQCHEFVLIFQKSASTMKQRIQTGVVTTK